jgi:hypothetical protein
VTFSGAGGGTDGVGILGNVTVSGIHAERLHVADRGEEAAPSLTIGDAGDGIYSPEVGRLSFSVGGDNIFYVASNRVTFAQEIRMIDGASNNPSYAFISDTNTGMYRKGSETVGLVGGGGEILTASGTGDQTQGVGVEGNLTVTGTVAAHTGNFSESLTISGVPVPLGGGPLAVANLSPLTDEEDFTILKVESETELTKMFSVIRGPGTPSVTWTVRHDTDRDEPGTEVVVGGTQTTSITTGDTITVLDNPTIPANSWVWLETTVTGGSPQEIAVELFV